MDVKGSMPSGKPARRRLLALTNGLMTLCGVDGGGSHLPSLEVLQKHRRTSNSFRSASGDKDVSLSGAPANWTTAGIVTKPSSRRANGTWIYIPAIAHRSGNSGNTRSTSQVSAQPRLKICQTFAVRGLSAGDPYSGRQVDLTGLS